MTPPNQHAHPEVTAEYLRVFFEQLQRAGVHDVVVSPGSRSTPLAMAAYKQYGDVYIDVDERGAAFFALGLAKATGSPVAVVCTSGTAVANWTPAVLEAESARVPLLLLSADRPPRLQNISAAQTCDQKHLFGTHVRSFYQMPVPSADADTLAYVRQVALDICVAAHGVIPGATSCDGAPVHVNFPFDEPLLIAMNDQEHTAQQQPANAGLPSQITPGHILYAADAKALAQSIAHKGTVALCGEGTCTNADEAQALLQFARTYHIPLLADPLSGLRSYQDPHVIDAYDAVYRAAEQPGGLQAVIRFGRWPVSKAARTAIASGDIHHIVVDVRDARDATATTTQLVRTTPMGFVQSMLQVAQEGAPSASQDFALAWTSCNATARDRIADVRIHGADDFEGTYIDQMLEMMPEYSLLFCANSMAIRALDTFYLAEDHTYTVLANRGLAGIDGTLSSAFGASQAFEQTTVLIGDLAFIHDANALAMQRELFAHAKHAGEQPPSIIVVVLNNNGGAIFDTLPQRSDADYFERLFLTPHDSLLRHLCLAFNVNHAAVSTIDDFRRQYLQRLGVPGINVIEVQLPLSGVADRYAPYWGTALKA